LLSRWMRCWHESPMSHWGVTDSIIMTRRILQLILCCPLPPPPSPPFPAPCRCPTWCLMRQISCWLWALLSRWMHWRCIWLISTITKLTMVLPPPPQVAHQHMLGHNLPACRFPTLLCAGVLPCAG
jgi:hypothetical protein